MPLNHNTFIPKIAILPISFSHPPPQIILLRSFSSFFGRYVHLFKLQPETSVVDVRKAILTGKTARWWSFSPSHIIRKGNKHVGMPAHNCSVELPRCSGHAAGKEVTAAHWHGFISLLSESLRCCLSAFLPAAQAAYPSSFQHVALLCLHRLLHPRPGTATCWVRDTILT